VSDLDKRRAEFGNQLRQIRARAGHLTGREFARHIGWQQSKVSRIENGKQTATDSDVLEWAEATGAPESVASALLDELREIRIEAASWKRQLNTGTGHKERQQTAQQVEQAATRIRAFEMALLPGLVQTVDYARHVLSIHARLHGSTADIEQALAVRMERQRILYDGTKSIELLVTEAVLRYPPCPPDVMAAQVDRLMALSGLSTVRFGIIPLGTQMPVIPMHGFWILDDRAVVVETIDSEITAEAPDDVALYHQVADQLWGVAAEGEPARRILVQISRDLTGT
jgi:transcriptional regulator with XRE-family HTH domain